MVSEHSRMCDEDRLLWTDSDVDAGCLLEDKES